MIGMLKMNPNERLSAKQAMQHPYFDGIDRGQQDNRKPPKDRHSIHSGFIRSLTDGPRNEQNEQSSGRNEDTNDNS